MSIAVAVRTGNDIVLATDSKRTFGGNAVPESNLRDVKLRRVGDAYLATTGWGVYANILDDYLRGNRNANLRDSRAIFSFFRGFWKALHQRYAFVNDQCTESDSPFGDLDASFLVVAKSGIYYVACDMSVTEFQQYYAVGSGATYALGAMHALYSPSVSAEAVARKAVAAASALDIYCGGEVNLITVRAGTSRAARGSGRAKRRGMPSRASGAAKRARRSAGK